MRAAIRFYFWSAVAWCQWHLVPNWYYQWWVKRHPKEAEETKQMFRRIAERAEQTFKNKVLDGRIIESTSALQCCCPVCPYGDGYNQNFLPTFYDVKTAVCPKCKTEFRACVTPGLEGK